MRYLLPITILVTFCLLLLGGYVHNTESSLACPDWPTCYGSFFPKMEGGVLIEHSHRLLATLVGILTIGLVLIAFRHYKSNYHLKNMTAFALFLVIVQGLLGGITVIYKLPTIVSTSHLTLAMFYFMLLFYLHHLVKKEQSVYVNFIPTEQDRLKWKPVYRHAILVIGLLVYLQIILGAFMRHSGAGAACGLGWQSAVYCTDLSAAVNTLWPLNVTSQLHMSHRLFAVFLVFSLLIICHFLWHNLLKKMDNFSKSLRKSLLISALLPVFLVIIQVYLGIATVGSNIGKVTTMLHLGVGALLLASIWSLYLKISAIEINLFGSKMPSVLSDLLDLTKPRLSGLVIVTALIGLVLAPEHVNFFKGLIAIIFTTLVVAGACALNCFLEWRLDALMERTKDRPLPANRMHPRSALIFGSLLLAISIPGLWLLVNPLTAQLGIAAALLYLFSYTPMKTRSSLSLYIGGIPGAIPPVMGWTAVMNEVTKLPILLFAILYIWQLPHFLAISIFHKDDYKSADIKTMVQENGESFTKIMIFVLTLILFLASLVPAINGDLSYAYRNTAIVLGLVFSILSIQGLVIGDGLAKNQIWARRYFRGSIIYLPLLLCAMVFLR